MGGTPMRRGFLLLEAMIASVILAVAAVAIASLLVTANEEQQAIRETNTATLLAKQLMEEIAALPLGSYPATTIPTSRALLKNANQYAGWQDSTDGSNGPAITTIGGETYPASEVGGYSRNVQISLVPNQTGIELVTVTVTTPSRKTVSLSKWLANLNWQY
jgi:type II secretory pathway pseudopilin PulG